MSPAVDGAARLLGRETVRRARAAVIKEHARVIGNFVDTGDTPLGQVATRILFDTADTNGDGWIDSEELAVAFRRLGFHVTDGQRDAIMRRAGPYELLSYEAFCAEAPRTLRIQLVRLAKRNGERMGLMVTL